MDSEWERAKDRSVSSLFSSLTSPVLVAGLGSAGRRITSFLNMYAVPWRGVDIRDDVKGAQFRSISEAFRNFAPSHIVIATPPDSHIPLIREAVSVASGRPLKILCEKPLCGLGASQEDWRWILGLDSDVVRVHWNYWFHREFRRAREQTSGGPLFAFSMQHRKSLPSWGLVLDHLSHWVWMLLVLGHGSLDVHWARSFSLAGVEVIQVGGEWAGGFPFLILEVVSHGSTNGFPRRAILRVGTRTFSLYRDSVMFADTLRAWFRNELSSVVFGVDFAFEVQMKLIEIDRLLMGLNSPGVAEAG